MKFKSRVVYRLLPDKVKHFFSEIGKKKHFFLHIRCKLFLLR